MNRVTILLSTYNGEKYLRQQLNSLINQDKVKLAIYIRDDGSTDSTPAILQEYALKYPFINLSFGKNIGAAKSFWSLVRCVPTNTKYYAFCDQDDIWKPDKLLKALEMLNLHSSLKPAMYYSRVTMVDETFHRFKHQGSTYQASVPTLGQLIAENSSTGCTMVWNKALQDIARQTKPHHIRMHDHFLHLICNFCDGNVIYDSNSYLLYRQHNSNVIGGKLTPKKYLGSIKRYLFEDSELVLQGLELYKLKNICKNTHKLKTLELYNNYKHNCSLITKLKLIMSGEYLQKNILMNIMISGMILINKL